MPRTSVHFGGHRRATRDPREGRTEMASAARRIESACRCLEHLVDVRGTAGAEGLRPAGVANDHGWSGGDCLMFGDVRFVRDVVFGDHDLRHESRHRVEDLPGPPARSTERGAEQLKAHCSGMRSTGAARMTPMRQNVRGRANLCVYDAHRSSVIRRRRGTSSAASQRHNTKASQHHRSPQPPSMSSRTFGSVMLPSDQSSFGGQ